MRRGPKGHEWPHQSPWLGLFGHEWLHLAELEEPQKRGQGVTVLDLPSPDQRRQLCDGHPLDAVGLARVRRLPNVLGAVRPVDVEPLVQESVRGKVGEELGHRPGPPAGLLQRLPLARRHRVLIRLDAPGRDLPAPGVGDEAVPVDQQNPISVDRHDARGVARHAHHVVLEAVATRYLDVDECERDPGALVDRPLAVDYPLHRKPSPSGSNSSSSARRLAKQRNPVWATMRWEGRKLRPRTVQPRCRTSNTSSIPKPRSSRRQSKKRCTWLTLGQWAKTIPPGRSAALATGAACQGSGRSRSTRSMSRSSAPR